MTTKQLSGNKGHAKQVVSGADLYEADDSFVVNVQQDKANANTGIQVAGSPTGAKFTGGQVIGTGINRAASWDHLYHRVEPGNGAAILLENCKNFTVERIKIQWPWDGLRPTDKCDGFTLAKSWLSDCRDDSIENDHGNSGKVADCLIENAHTFISARPGKGSNPGDTTVGTKIKMALEITGCLFSQGAHLEDRAKRTYAWSNREGGKVMQPGQFFKVDGEGKGTKVVMRGCTIMAKYACGAAKSKQRLIPQDWDFSGSDNTFIWLGKDNIPGLTYETIDGVRVPKEFELGRVKSAFRVVGGEAGGKLWGERRQAWLDDVWSGAPTPPAEPPGVPQDVAVAGVGSRSVLLTWSPPTSPGSAPVGYYAVYRDGAVLVQVTGASCEDRTVQPAKSYGYQIEAFNEAGGSGLSDVVTATTLSEAEPPVREPDPAVLESYDRLEAAVQAERDRYLAEFDED